MSSDLVKRLESLVDEYAEAYFRFNPVNASILGAHEFDAELGDWSAANLQSRARFLSEIKREVEGILRSETFESIPLSKRIDARLLFGRISLEISEIEKARIYAKKPSLYVDNCLYGLFVPMARGYAPAKVRARALISRLDQIPVFLHNAKSYFDAPPEIFTRIAMDMTKAGVEFMDEVASFVAQEAPSYASQAAASAGAAKEAFRSFAKFLEEELLPRSRGSFRAGEEHYNERLEYEHMLQADASALEAKGREVLESVRAQMEELSAKMEPGADLRELIARISSRHPDAAEIKRAYEREMERAKRFVLERKLATIPAGEKLRIVDTPGFERSIIPYAAYLPPGPFEEQQEGLFYVTPVEEGAAPEEVEDRLKGHNYASMAITALHEGYPGHHLQLVRASANPSKMRKLTESSLFAEGWALYCEEMMYEQGFYPNADTRLYQLKDSLWRAARVLIDVGLHAGDMDFDEAVNFLVEKAMLERTNAVAEVKRYTLTPTQPMTYTIGKLEILDMLRAAREARSDLELREFHDALLDAGTVPPPLVKEEVLEKLSPSRVK